jgi:cyclic pyranopterin phosphate synthase
MLSHVDKNNRPNMVDVSDKEVTKRTAAASARVKLPEAVRSEFANGEIHTKKGPVIDTAIVAGTIPWDWTRAKFQSISMIPVI